MKTLYLLTEDDSDSLFHEACAQQLTGEGFKPVCRRLRKGTGIGAVRSSLKLVLHEMSRMTEGSGAHFIVAMDNDRAPHAASAEAIPTTERRRLPNADLHKHDRYAGLIAELETILGHDRSQWKIPVAVAVPVEMLESWLLLISQGGQADDLPRFAGQDSSFARHFYHPAPPPPQLKDLANAACAKDECTDTMDWMLHLVFEKLNPEDLAGRSASFRLFKTWLDTWPKASKTN